jgi:hypothetical protein
VESPSPRLAGEHLPPSGTVPPDEAQYGFFICRNGHEWRSKRPRWRDVVWSRCPECGELAFFREPRWHRMAAITAPIAGLGLLLYAIIVDQLRNPGLVACSIGLIAFGRSTRSSWY